MPKIQNKKHVWHLSFEKCKHVYLVQVHGFYLKPRTE